MIFCTRTGMCDHSQSSCPQLVSFAGCAGEIPGTHLRESRNGGMLVCRVDPLAMKTCASLVPLPHRSIPLQLTSRICVSAPNGFHYFVLGGVRWQQERFCRQPYALLRSNWRWRRVQGPVNPLKCAKLFSSELSSQLDYCWSRFYLVCCRDRPRL